MTESSSENQSGQGRPMAGAKTEDDEEDDHDATVRGRRVRHWTAADGWGHGEWRLPLESQARLVAMKSGAMAPIVSRCRRS